MNTQELNYLRYGCSDEEWALANPRAHARALTITRKLQSLSLLDAAAALLISVAELERIESGELDPSDELLSHIATVYDLDASHLIAQFSLARRVRAAQLLKGA